MKYLMLGLALLALGCDGEISGLSGGLGERDGAISERGVLPANGQMLDAAAMDGSTAAPVGVDAGSHEAGIDAAINRPDAHVEGGVDAAMDAASDAHAMDAADVDTAVDEAAPDADAPDADVPELDSASPEPDAEVEPEPDSGEPPQTLRLPPANGAFDYQLFEGYAPATGVVTVSRDRTDDAAPGLYNICYVNGFQVQPNEDDLWDEDLILRDDSGAPVIDEDWVEALLDVSTAAKRARVAAVINGFIDGCASKGFDAIEIDNLDSYARSGGRLSEANAVATMTLLSAHAHALGLAIAQKNSTELLDRRAAMGTDFAVAEECSRYDECGDYVDAYGPNVLMIEYRQQDFEEGCAGFGDTHGIVLRDLDLDTPGSGEYVFEGC
jgi:hypothetical protein